MLKSKSLHYFLSKLFHVFISVCLIFFNIFTARAETFFSLLSEKKVLLSTDRCEEVVIFRDTGAIVEPSSSHCLRNERRISHFPGAFYLLKYFSKIVFLSMVRFFLVTISDFRAHPISSAGPSSSNDICIYIYIYIHTLSFTVSGTVPPPCFSCAASFPGRTAFLFPGHTCFCHSPDVFLRKRNAGRTWCTSFFTGFIVTVSLLLKPLLLLWVFFALGLALTVWKETLEIALSVFLFNWGRGLLLCWQRLSWTTLGWKFTGTNSIRSPHQHSVVGVCNVINKTNTPYHFTGVDFTVRTLRTAHCHADSSHCARWLMAVTICDAITVSWPALRYILIRLFIVAALQVHDPFPP